MFFKCAMCKTKSTRTQRELVSLCVKNAFTSLLISKAKDEMRTRNIFIIHNSVKLGQYLLQALTFHLKNLQRSQSKNEQTPECSLGI